MPDRLQSSRKGGRRRAGVLQLPIVLGLSIGLGILGAPAAAFEVLPAGFSRATPSFIGQTAGYVASQRQVPPPSAARDLCDRFPWACAASGDRSPLTREQLQSVVVINRRINNTVPQITDQAQYGVEDYWALPTARGGDCEDFALLKKLELMRAGIAPERLLIATVLDRRLRAHAVLVLRTDFGDFVLDNLTTEIKPWTATGYTFLKMQNPNAPHRWVGALIGGLLTS